MNGKANIVIFRDRLLHFSEGFVLTQGEALQSYHPFYAGSSSVGEIDTPGERTVTLHRGKAFASCREALFKALGIAPRFFGELRRIAPVLIHAHFGVDGALALPVARALMLPLVVTFHGYDVTMKDDYLGRVGPSSRIYLRRREALKAEGARFVAVSDFIRRELLAKGFPAERIAVNHIGVDLELFRPDPAVRREKLVLFVGRLSAEKGCRYLIEAMTAVESAVPEVATVIIGAGAELGALKRLASERLRSCSFLGPLPPGEVRRWMNRATALCVPSIRVDSGQSEALGLVFVEAQAMGLPVVSFAVGGIPEAVIDGETGLLCREKESWQLASAITELLCNEPLWLRLSRRGQAHVAERFDLRKQSRALEALYRETLGIAASHQHR